jgi:NADH pyrophosphatase NudC (nudix superfamily)
VDLRALLRPAGVLAQGLMDAILPQTCVVCGQWIPARAGLACGPCGELMGQIARVSYCPHCGRTMPTTAIDQVGCARCKHEDFWNVAGVARVGAYPP